jgi:hypothetical protein
MQVFKLPMGKVLWEKIGDRKKNGKTYVLAKSLYSGRYKMFNQLMDVILISHA